MKWSGTAFLCFLPILFSVGCETLHARRGLHEYPRTAGIREAWRPSTAGQITPVRQASLGLPTEVSPPRAPVAGENPFAGMKDLSVEALVEQVLARNPTLAQMIAAWQAASARYPQVTSLEDPMLGAKLGPGSFGSNTVDFAYMVELSQKFPFPGKLGLRGQSALAEASAAGNEVEDVRLQLIESARSAFYDYFLVTRALEINEENLKRLKEFKENAEARYKTGLVPQQDVLQADVELGREGERRLTLEETRLITVARMNTLMRLSPDSPLPPPPKELSPGAMLPEVQMLRVSALASRPDIGALENRIQADQAALALAQKEYYPDVEVMAGYDAFWQERPLRTQVGLRLNLPVRLSRRDGAVAEAQARIMQRSAELDRLKDQVGFQVQEAYEKVRKSEKAVRLYQKTILPAAEANVKAAQAAYTTGKTPFLSLIEAQRNLINLRDRYYEAVADYFRRGATLERVVGGPLKE